MPEAGGLDATARSVWLELGGRLALPEQLGQLGWGDMYSGGEPRHHPGKHADDLQDHNGNGEWPKSRCSLCQGPQGLRCAGRYRTEPRVALRRTDRRRKLRDLDM